jgi:hypothetical protein
MTSHQVDSVLPIDALLARIRACIVGNPLEAIVSLMINVERIGEKTVFRLSVQSDGSLVGLSMEDFVLSPSPESMAEQLPSIPSLPPSPQHSATPRDASQPSTVIEMSDEEDDVDSSKGMNDKKSSMDVEEGDGAAILQHSAPKHDSDSDTSASRSATSPVVHSSSSSNNIRRSARPQHPPDRLVYVVTGTRTQGPKRQADSSARSAARADVAEPTDAESGEVTDSAWTPSSAAASSTPRHQLNKQRKKHHHHADVRHTLLYMDDSGEQEQVESLVMKLKESHARQQKQLDLECISQQGVLQLGRDILGDGQLDWNGVDVDLFGYQRCAIKLDLLISTSTAMRMVGYYLRAVLAARLKRSHKNKYVRSARVLLGLRSSADITAYPAFYSFIQQHCPSVASGTMDIEAWLQEPIFLADIGWAEWRRYLSKSHRWIMDTAIERFTASLQPPRDWMQRSWVEEYNNPYLGRAVRAVRDIPLPVSDPRRPSSAVDAGDNFTVAADLCLLAQAQQPEPTGKQQQTAPWYRFEWDGGTQRLDAERLWVGKIDHLPMPHCNLKLTGGGKLVQRRAIAAGEALTFDYGVQWWAHRVTGLTWNEWMTTGTLSCRKGAADLFYRMHESVLDYTPLLRMEWDQQLSNAASELERETVLMEIWEHVHEGRHDEVAA